MRLGIALHVVAFIFAIGSLAFAQNSFDGPYSSQENIAGGGLGALSLPFAGPTRLKFAYAELPGRATFEFGNGAGIVSSVIADYRLKGSWLEVNQFFFLSEDIEFGLTGGYFIPSYDHVDETYELIFPPNVIRSWSTDTELWTVGTSLTYRIDGPIVLAIGYMYGSFDLRFDSLEKSSGPIGFINPGSTVEVRAHAPFVGFMLDHRDLETNLNLGIIACPRLFGTLAYQIVAPLPGAPSGVRGDFRNTYFVGLTGEYSHKLGVGYFGAFFRWLPIVGSFGLTVDGAPLGDSLLRINASFWMTGGQFAVLF